jgi:hypothetical protein
MNETYGVALYPMLKISLKAVSLGIKKGVYRDKGFILRLIISMDVRDLPCSEKIRLKVRKIHMKKSYGISVFHLRV